VRITVHPGALMAEAVTWRSFARALLLVSAALFLAGCGGKGGTQPPPDQEAAIAIQPLSQTVPIGQTAVFTVTTTETAPIAYQWSENGVAIPGATNSSYTTPAVELGTDGSTAIGSFQVKVSNAFGSVVSNIATLTAGPRSPKAGDLRYLQYQQVDQQGLFNESGAGGVEIDVGGTITWNRYTSAIGSPLMMGSSFVCGAGSCAWGYEIQVLPAPLNGFIMNYRPGLYSNLSSDLASYAASNVVFTSLDLEAAEDAYAVSWVEAGQATGFDYKLEVVSPAQFQSTATADGNASRVITAVSFDESGNTNLISYGWTGDTTTAYETQTTIVPADQVITTATNLAGDGYIISAFGGNDTDGYMVVGMRVKGDSLPRPITVSTPVPTSMPYYMPVIYLAESGAGASVIYER